MSDAVPFPRCLVEPIADCALGQPPLITHGHDLELPVIVVWLIIGLFVFFFVSLEELWRRSIAFNGRFRKLITPLLQEAANRGEVDAALLNRVGEVLSADVLSEHGWNEFKETLITDESGSQTRIYNTRQAEEFFSEDEIVSRSMHPRFFRAVPGLLTSIGLLATFVAILLGLGQIEMTGESISGIDGFINALAAKFASSVIALTLAIVFTLMETRVLQSAHLRYQKFCQALDSVFPRKTTEELLISLRKDTAEQLAAFQHFNTDLSARFRDGVTEGLGPVLERISEGLMSMTGERDSNIEAMMARFTEEFRKAMSQSAGVELGQIGSTLDQAAQLIGSANQQTQQAHASFARLVESMERAQSKQEEGSRRQEAVVTQMLQQMSETIGRASNDSQAAMDDTIRGLLQAMTAARTQQEEGARRQAEMTTSLLQQMIDGVGRASGQSQAAMDDTVRDLMEKTGSFSNKMNGEFQTLLEQHRTSLKSVGEMQGALERTLELWNRGTGEMQQVVAPLRDTARELQSATSSLRGAASEIEKSQQQLTRLFADARTEFTRLEQMGASNQRLLVEHQRVFETVQSGLGGVLKTITDKVETLQEVSGRGLTKHLREFDNHLGTATKKLGASVDELGEVLEEAAETIKGAARR